MRAEKSGFTRVIDHALNLVGLQRAPAKRSSVFAGAAGSRLTLDWVAPILSADQECRGNLRLLRARGRELVRNNPIARHFLNLLSANVVGPAGIRYQSLVRSADGEIDRKTNKAIESAWDEWCTKGNCTVDGKMSFRAYQDLCLRTEAMDGESFTRLVRGFDNKWGFALQSIDADQVDHLFSRPGGNRSGENEVRLGIEVNKWGRPVTYWVNPGHPSDFGGSLLREPISADQIIHLFDPYRVNQTRGLTWFHAGMMSLKMLNGYMEAEIVAARVGAAKMAFLVNNDPAAFDAQNDDPQQPLRMEANAGMIEQLPAGWDIKEFKPDHPANAFENFIKTNLRWVASSLGASYNALANDLQGVNYSSLRSGLLIERDHWKQVQKHVAEDFIQPIFEEWLKMSLLTGALKLDSRDHERYKQGKWIPRGWQWVDPYKETQAAIMGIAAALQTRDQVISDRGGDVEDVFEQLAEEDKMAEEFGIDLVAALPSRPSTQNNPAAVDDEEEPTENPAADKEQDEPADTKATKIGRTRKAAAKLLELLQ
jgi:lambda family phage portal protein